MILYPTETLYALGVNALDEHELFKLYELKDRDKSKPASWLVRDIEDIQKYAEVTDTAKKIIEHFLPGKLTLVLRAKSELSRSLLAQDGTVSFRISRDPVAQQLIAQFMEKHDAPLTCTSANVSGLATLSTPGEILQQFGLKARMVTKVIDDGPRKGLASTIVRVIGNDITLLREGDIGESEIRNVLVEK